jgi:nitrite reductase/ring-hydroxylating ferredoxin subunit/uncharacterized membrane protein
MGYHPVMPTRKPVGDQLVKSLGEVEALDTAAKPLAAKVRELTSPKAVKEALSGTWLGHPVHPLLVGVPIGTWVGAVMLDWLGGEDSERAADLLVGFGLATAIPTVATGYNDWADSEPASDQVRRVGLVHAACNATAATLFGTSLAARAGGNRLRGKLLGLAGLGALGAAGYLGGHLTYAEGVGVDPSTFEEFPEDWTAVLADAALGEGEMKSAEVDGVAIMVARLNGELHALSDTCVHRGGSLADGEIDGDCVVCPLHSSAFRLEDGSVERGPATYPQPVLEIRVQDGSIEVRAPS